jgi:hypothetical protein
MTESAYVVVFSCLFYYYLWSLIISEEGWSSSNKAEEDKFVALAVMEYKYPFNYNDFHIILEVEGFGKKNKLKIL